MKYLIDLDGTLLDGLKANKDSVEFINELQKRNIDFLIMTNSIKSPQVISQRLSNVGISVPISRILNPISAINIYLKKMGVRQVFSIGSNLEIDQIEANYDKDNPKTIVLLDFEKENISYKDMQYIFSLIQKGIPVITASGSSFYLKDGIQYLDTGSFVKLFENAANMQIKILGKPSPEYFNAGITLLNEKAANITVIGDDWNTDVNGALAAGCNSVLIRSGKYKQGDENKCKVQKTVNYLMELFEA